MNIKPPGFQSLLTSVANTAGKVRRKKPAADIGDKAWNELPYEPPKLIKKANPQDTSAEIHSTTDIDGKGKFIDTKF